MPTHGPDLSRLSLSQLARLAGCDRRTARSRLEGLEPVEQTGRELRYDARRALSRIYCGKPVGRRSAHARDLIRSLALRDSKWLPWLEPGELVTLPDYAEQIGVEYEEVVSWLNLGLPTLPPPPGEVGARVSVPHAECWRTLFSILVEHLGGDGLALEIGVEARTLAEVPIVEDGPA